MKWLGFYIRELVDGPWPIIYLIRHGHGYHQLAHEMYDNKLVKSPREVLVMPNHLIPLTPLGRWQAEETRKQIDIQPDIVFVSEIWRAEETARIIFPNARKIRPDWRLNEKEFGPAHLLSDEELRERFPFHDEQYKLDGKYFAARAPGGENYPMMMARAHNILRLLRKKWAGKTVALVCHSAIINAIRKLYEHLDYKEVTRLSKMKVMENCGIVHYGWPNKLLKGWEKGKYGHILVRPPYKLWELDQEKKEYFLRQALEELPGVRENYLRQKDFEEKKLVLKA